MRKRILAVDDQAEITRLLKRGLELTGDFEVCEENDPRAAIAAAEAFEPHLILVDVMMPDIDGGELAALFRANDKLKAVPIVFLTAAITKEEAASHEGRIAQWPVIAKPLVMTEVAACVRQHLGVTKH